MGNITLEFSKCFLVHYLIHPHSNSIAQVLLTTNQETSLLRGSGTFLKSPNDRSKVELRLPKATSASAEATSATQAKWQNITNKCK